LQPADAANVGQRKEMNMPSIHGDARAVNNNQRGNSGPIPFIPLILGFRQVAADARNGTAFSYLALTIVQARCRVAALRGRINEGEHTALTTPMNALLHAVDGELNTAADGKRALCGVAVRAERLLDAMLHLSEGGIA
jgi:hypothetical protein